MYFPPPNNQSHDIITAKDLLLLQFERAPGTWLERARRATYLSARASVNLIERARNLQKLLMAS